MQAFPSSYPLTLNSSRGEPRAVGDPSAVTLIGSIEASHTELQSYLGSVDRVFRCLGVGSKPLTRCFPMAAGSWHSAQRARTLPLPNQNSRSCLPDHPTDVSFRSWGLVVSPPLPSRSPIRLSRVRWTPHGTPRWDIRKAQPFTVPRRKTPSLPIMKDTLLPNALTQDATKAGPSPSARQEDGGATAEGSFPKFDGGPGAKYSLARRWTMSYDF